MKILLITTFFILVFLPRARASKKYPKWQDYLKYGETLFPGQRLRSNNGRFVLDMQLDSNLVLSDGGRVLWMEEEETFLSKGPSINYVRKIF